jgi:hypothetical protein
MRRKSLLAGCLTLALAVLSGCSGAEEPSAQETVSQPDGGRDDSASPSEDSPTEPEGEATGGDYCDALAEAQADLAALETGPAAAPQLEQLVATFEDLAEQAPAEVADDWQQLISFFDRLDEALGEVGLKLADLGNPVALQQLTPKEVRELQTLVAGLQSKQLEQAAQKLTRHAKKECGVQLGGGQGR